MPTSTPRLPQDWQDTEQLDGLEVVDKAQLLEVPFRITSLYFETNQRGVSFVYVDAEDADSNGFTFNDSSSGVRQQLVSYLIKSEQDSAVESGEVVKMNLVIPKGLRVSNFTVKDDHGRDKAARTYYLTTSGKRAGADNPKPSAPARRRTATRK